MGTVKRGTLAVIIRKRQRPPAIKSKEIKTWGKEDIRAG